MMWTSLSLLAVLAGSPAMSDTKAQDEAVVLAKQTLASQLKAAAGGIEVIQVDAVDWPDSSLGCPQPGMMYAQMIVSGYKVVLSTGGATYPVHIGSGRAVICTQSKARKTLD